MAEYQEASYGISKDAKIRTSSGKTYNKTISELYSMPEKRRKKIKFRCVDESTGDIRYDYAEDILYLGVKTTYTIRTIHGYEMRATPEHPFLTENGWKQLKDIKLGERIYINGQNSYLDKDWLNQKYNIENLSQEEIALLCGVSVSCIHKWVGKFDLQKERGSWSKGVPSPYKGHTKRQNTYADKEWLTQKYVVENLTQEEIALLCGVSVTCICEWVGKFDLQKERGSWSKGVAPTNKGRTKFDYSPLMNASIKRMRKVEELTDSGLRSRTANEMYPLRTGVCEYCGFVGATEIHHLNKDLTEYNTNLVELCISCHNAIHRKEIAQRTVLSEVVSIEKYGEEDTYDIVMAGVHHNFVADGFVVHDPQQNQV